MFSISDAQELKALSYKCAFDKKSPTSGRVGAAIIYAIVRVGDIIDWWFPVKNLEDNKMN
jgi:hypothetical protein